MLRFYDPPLARFAGKYPQLSNNLLKNAWTAVIYATLCIAFFYGVGQLTHPLLYFCAVQIPTIVCCVYVTAPNIAYRYRLPFNWIITSLAVGLVSLLRGTVQPPWDGYLREMLSGLITVMFLYWIVMGLNWSLRSVRYTKSLPESEDGADIVGSLFAIWGLTMLMAGTVVHLILPIASVYVQGAMVGKWLVNNLNFLLMASVTRFLPIGMLVFGLVVLTAFRMRNNQFVPDEFPEVEPDAGIWDTMIRMATIPLWMGTQIYRFVMHFGIVFVGAACDLFNNYVPRTLCIVLGLLLVPALLLLGHLAVLKSVEILAYTVNSPGPTYLSHFFEFLASNFLFLTALCLYLSAIPFLAIRYRNATLVQPLQVLEDLQADVVSEGFAAMKSVGKGFSLFGIIVVAVPIAALVPGAPSYGTFAALYFLVLLGAIFSALYRKFYMPTVAAENNTVEKNTRPKVT